MDSREGLQDCACQNCLFKEASSGREKGSTCDTGETLRMCMCDFVLIIKFAISLFTTSNNDLDSDVQAQLEEHIICSASIHF